jgi:hypothetical protein
MEAKWTENVRGADASTMDAVTQVLAASTNQPYRVQTALLICRTPEHFASAPSTRVVNGFRLHEVVATL